MCKTYVLENRDEGESACHMERQTVKEQYGEGWQRVELSCCGSQEEGAAQSGRTFPLRLQLGPEGQAWERKSMWEGMRPGN